MRRSASFLSFLSMPFFNLKMDLVVSRGELGTWNPILEAMEEAKALMEESAGKNQGNKQGKEGHSCLAAFQGQQTIEVEEGQTQVGIGRRTTDHAARSKVSLHAVLELKIETVGPDVSLVHRNMAFTRHVPLVFGSLLASA